ncbi:cysteine hydrolase [Streptomyces sp. NBC_01433]|uniref:cysteine hydrolase family protein n=1 Tax=Streptomyces sp. NBC_01433 TaxID=2903864 RepID=UPI0022527E73|nr:cysteine hydrolase [Streptomyces sp. NBC_01433]MCX4679089.1 cysteine hydrolase [Streptomyces sp. NBC_01433]
MTPSAPAVPALVPERTALLAMDFQNGIAPLSPEPDALIARVRNAIADVRAAGGTIGHVRVAFTEDDWAAVPDRNKSFSSLAASKAMHHEHDATQIHEDVFPREADIVVRKVRFGAASTTDLYGQLADRGIDTLILTGISTSGVVLSTLMDAADRDYQMYVLSDCVADRDPETHRILVDKVFPSRAHIIDTARLRTLLAAG